MTNSDAALLSLLDQANTLISTADTQGYFIYLNATWTEVLGFGLDELKSKPSIEFVHPEDRQYTIDENLSLFNNKGKSVNFRNRYKTSNSGYVWLDWSSKVTEEGVIVATAHDVTQLVEDERTIKRQVDTLDQIAHIAHIGHWEVDFNSQSLFWSDEIFEIHGLTSETYKPQIDTAIDFYHPDDKEQITQYVNDALEQNIPGWDFQLRIIRGDGSIRYVRSIAEIERDQNNNPVSIFGIFQDVTDANALIEERNILADISNLTTTGVIITDANQKVTWLNKAFNKITGYTLEDVKGKSLGPILQGPDTDKKISKHIRNTLNARNGVNVEILNYKKSGTPYWNNLVINPITRNGKVSHYIGLQHDVTSRKISDFKLLEKERHYRSIINTAQEVIFQLDANYEFVYLNSFWQELVGTPKDKAIGDSIADYCYDSYERRQLCTLLKYDLDPSKNSVFQFKLKVSNNSYKHVELKITKADYQYESNVRYQGTIDDISELKVKEAIAVNVQRLEMTSQLISGVCHDFNNLLSIIRGNVELLELKSTNKDLNKYIFNIGKAAKRGSNFTDKLLNSTVKKQSNYTEVDVSKTLASVVSLVTETMPQNMTIETQLDSNKSCLTDKSEFEDCIINLIINASHALVSSGLISISTETFDKFNDADVYTIAKPITSDEYIKVTIKDNGSGIPKALFSEIFKPFFTTKENDQGSGLGLSMLNGFITRQNFGLTMASEIGKGTSFNIWLPVYSVLSEENPQPIENKTISDKGFVIIIDDEEDIADMVEEQFQAIGWDAKSFSDVNQAMSYITQNEKDITLVLTDEIMPGNYQGHHVAKTVKALNKKIKVIIMTGFLSDDEVKKANCSIIYKPFEFSKLLRLIDQPL